MKEIQAIMRTSKMANWICRWCGLGAILFFSAHAIFLKFPMSNISLFAWGVDTTICTYGWLFYFCARSYEKYRKYQNEEFVEKIQIEITRAYANYSAVQDMSQCAVGYIEGLRKAKEVIRNEN